MKIIPVHKDNQKIYDICISDSFEAIADYKTALKTSGRRVCIVTDSNVDKLYSNAVMNYFIDSPLCTKFVFPAGEDNKTLDTVKDLYEFLILNRFDRSDILVALGGGVTGDLTGYTAATYLRGIDFIQIPTSLLAFADSSIGGKTGVDFNSYKNMIGAFHMPKLVYINVSVLSSLNMRQFSSGMAEIIKHGLIKDRAYYEALNADFGAVMAKNYSICENVIYNSCNIKRKVVENDPTEKGERALLNFGHTLGHAIEKFMNFKMLHGECVALGSICASYISLKRNLISLDEYNCIVGTFSSYGLPVRLDLSEEDIHAVILHSKSDKKMKAGHIRFVILNALGNAAIAEDVTDNEMFESLIAISKEIL